MSKARPDVAFLVAAIVLLALPLLMMAGLVALGAAAIADIRSGVSQVTAGGMGVMFLAFAVVWILILVAAIAALVWRITRSTARS